MIGSFQTVALGEKPTMPLKVTDSSQCQALAISISKTGIRISQYKQRSSCKNLIGIAAFSLGRISQKFHCLAGASNPAPSGVVHRRFRSNRIERES